jgi:PAS domain S-box-containing protein
MLTNVTEFMAAEDHHGVAPGAGSTAQFTSGLPDTTDTVQLALLAAIVDSSEDAIVSKTLDGQIRSWNAGAARIFGYEAHEVIGKPITIIIPPELHAEEQQILQKIRRGERIDHFETTRIAKDGRRIEVSLTISPILDRQGRIVGASKNARDIGEQRRLERTRALLAAIVESSDDAIVSKNLSGIIQTWNAGAMRTFGYTAEEAIGKPITLIIPPELQDEERRIIAQLREGKRIEHFDTTRVAKDGRRIPISITVSPIRDARGVVIGASKVARDISERKEAERALLESERALAAEAAGLEKLNECSSRLWRSANLDDGFRQMLDAAMSLLGADKGVFQLLRADNMLVIAAHRGFEPDFLAYFAEVSDDHMSACSRALKCGRPVIIEDVESDAQYAPLRARARAAGYRAVASIPLMRSNGAILGIFSSHFLTVYRPSEQDLRRFNLYLRQASDFIQRCKLEQTLRESEEALREADRRKDEFLALLAHELRNPLAPIRYALATSTKAGRTAEQQRRAEEVIERQVAHMSHLLDDLLDVSRITRGTLALKKCATELTSVVGAAIESARPLLDAKRHALQLDLPKEPVRLDADPVRLAQVFCNLLINAAKYTDPDGQIQLRIVREADDVLVSVRDNGIGISEDIMPRLFTPFTQASSAVERSEGGLGVGLSLVRGLVTLHGGSVEAHSAGANQGSEFIVRLPLGEPAPESDTDLCASLAKNGAGLKIMVIDDNQDAAETCALLLELSGHRVKTAFTGRRALELAAAFAPNAMLVDIGLPDINGYELARKIRAASWGRDAVLIALTGWGQEEDRRRAFEAGFNHHLTKPIAPEVLESVLQSAVATAAEKPIN